MVNGRDEVQEVHGIDVERFAQIVTARDFRDIDFRRDIGELVAPRRDECRDHSS